MQIPPKAEQCEAFGGQLHAVVMFLSLIYGCPFFFAK